MYSAKLVGNQMDTVFGLYLPEYEVPAPKVQTNYKEVPYRDGAIDKTAPDGVVTFEDREWSLVFQKTGEDVSAYDVPALSASLMNAIHGKSGEIIFDDDPNYKWVGRVFVENVQCENNGLIIANISLITQPYKYGIQDIVVTDTIETEVDEYQGSIVSFEYSLGKELTKLLANIAPSQDLHGYANPWPAGGGVNKCSYDTDYTPTAGVNNGTINLFSLTLAAGTYTFSCKQSVNVATSTRNTLVVKVGSNATQYENGGTNYNPANLRHTITFTVSEESTVVFSIWCHTPSTAATYNEWQVESGSFTAYYPYSNICPISGLTGLSVYRTGANLFPPNPTCVYGKVRDDNGDEVVSSTSFYTTTYIPVKASTKYTLKLVGQKAINSARIYYLAPDGSWISRTSTIYSTPTTFTTPSGCGMVEFQFSITGEQNLDNFDLYLCEGETATTEPFGNTYYVDWSTQAGTVYGGTVDVVTGVLTVDRAIYNLGDATWNKDGNRTGNFYTNALSLDIENSGWASLCSQYVVNNSANANTIANGELSTAVSYGSKRIFIKDTAKDSMTGAQFKTAMNGVQLVYELATPITYQLTSVQIAMLLGINNVWSDVGDVDAVISTFDMVTLSNGRKPQSPKISVTSEGEVTLMFFVKGTKHIINLAAGEWSIPDLMLFEGDTDVYESGEGTVTYTYKEASL